MEELRNMPYKDAVLLRDTRIKRLNKEREENKDMFNLDDLEN